MRDVALAGRTDTASATNAHAAHNSFALRMPGIPTLPWKFVGLRDTPMTRLPHLLLCERRATRGRGFNGLISFEILRAGRNHVFTPIRAKLPCAAVFAGPFTHH